jgi:hypothetical protein
MMQLTIFSARFKFCCGLSDGDGWQRGFVSVEVFYQIRAMEFYHTSERP